MGLTSSDLQVSAKWNISSVTQYPQCVDKIILGERNSALTPNINKILVSFGGKIIQIVVYYLYKTYTNRSSKIRNLMHCSENAQMSIVSFISDQTKYKCDYTETDR